MSQHTIAHGKWYEALNVLHSDGAGFEIYRTLDKGSRGYFFRQGFIHACLIRMYGLYDNFETAATRKAQSQHIFNSNPVTDFLGLRFGKVALENTLAQIVFNTTPRE